MIHDVFSIVGLEGSDPFTLQANSKNPSFHLQVAGNLELEKLGGFYVADPFVFLLNGKEYLFFELLRRDGKGVIARAEREFGKQKWCNYVIVLEEPFHLSYPIIFKEDHWLYMTVESAEANEVRLYRTEKSGTHSWSFYRTLLEGEHYDPTPFQYQESWFMYTCTELDFSVTNLFFSEESIDGPWYPHPASPIVENDSGSARPAGPLLEWNKKAYRLAQDCSERYGAAVKAFEILKLTKTEYFELEKGILLSGAGVSTHQWNSHGMHQLHVYKKTNGSICGVSDGYTRV